MLQLPPHPPPAKQLSCSGPQGSEQEEGKREEEEEEEGFQRKSEMGCVLSQGRREQRLGGGFCVREGTSCLGDKDFGQQILTTAGAKTIPPAQGRPQEVSQTQTEPLWGPGPCCPPPVATQAQCTAWPLSTLLLLPFVTCQGRTQPDRSPCLWPGCAPFLPPPPRPHPCPLSGCGSVPTRPRPPASPHLQDLAQLRTPPLTRGLNTGCGGQDSCLPCAPLPSPGPVVTLASISGP